MPFQASGKTLFQVPALSSKNSQSSIPYWHFSGSSTFAIVLEEFISGCCVNFTESAILNFSGSFTFASVVEDFISGSRINMNYNAVTWSKFFLFAGKEYIPFFPNLNPSFSKIAALEYSVNHRNTIRSWECRLRNAEVTRPVHFLISLCLSYISV